MKSLYAIAACAALALPGAVQAMPNPASIFCGKMAGRSVMAKLPDGGTIGLCYLPGKKIVEEWTLFRMMNGKVPSPRHNMFR
ncbi:DUF333 domain-containing protein [Sphingomonas fuzhouensis]|uniref:DUF333 domain-containing protein n=1 Tax=Sphingomonas fuzhouensis TaxID=3106033 RepID=UPI002AFF00C8|nr:DUF333 domain-containing protein [Sphingomonas sp. SGZ-02]